VVRLLRFRLGLVSMFVCVLGSIMGECSILAVMLMG